MPISASRCSGRPVRVIRAAAADRRGLVAGGRQAGRRVEVLGRREALDRQRVGGERGGADGRDAGQRGQDLAGAVGQQLLDLVVDERDVLAQASKAREVAAEPLRRAARRRRGGARQSLPARGPERARWRRSAGRRRAPCSDRDARRAPGERDRAGQHRPPGRRLQRQRAAVPRRAPRGPGTSALSWSCRRWRSGLSASTSWRRCATAAQQRLDRRGARGPPGALARQPDQRRAIAIVGLEPSRPQLRPRRLRLRRREQPQRPRPAPLELGRPRPMQRPGRLDREHRRPPPADQRLEPIDARRATSATTPARRPTRSPVVTHTRLQHLARIDRHDHPIHRQSL